MEMDEENKKDNVGKVDNVNEENSLKRFRCTCSGSLFRIKVNEYNNIRRVQCHKCDRSWRANIEVKHNETLVDNAK